MLRNPHRLIGAMLLGLLLVGAVVGCSLPRQSQTGQESIYVSAIETRQEQQPDGQVGANADVIGSAAPCTGPSDSSCHPRDVSHYNLFAPNLGGSAFVGDLGADSVEDVLEKGLRLAEVSPTHLAVRGTPVGNSTRCDWRGVARTATQREQAVRFWLELAAADPLPTAVEVERRFMAELDRIRVILPETAKANFTALAQGGLNDEYLFLTCYVDITASEYLLGAGPTTVTLAYDRMGRLPSPFRFRTAHESGITSIVHTVMLISLIVHAIA